MIASRNVFWCGALAGALLLSGAPALAVRSTFPSHGFVVDTAGTALSGAKSVTFSLYSAATGGTALWTETQTVTFSGGVYSTTLGATTALPSTLVSSTEALYLGIAIESDREMTPRLEYTTTPWALLADHADTADALSSAAAAATAGAGITNTAGVLSIAGGSGISVSDDGIAIDTSDALTWTASQTYSGQVVVSRTPSSTASTAASVYINPSSVTANSKLLAIANDSSDMFTVDAEGDVVMTGNVTIVGTLNGSAVGDVQSLTAGAGLSGGGTSGDLTLAVGAGNAITVNGDDVAVTTNGINEDELAATLTFGSTDFVDLALVTHGTTALQGMRLPQVTGSPSNPVSGEGFIAWDATNNLTKIYNGTAWATVGDTLGIAIDSSEITNDSIVNADVNASAAIAYSKLNLSSSITSADLVDNTITAADLNATLTFSDGDLLDLSSINPTSATEGLKLPQAASVTAATAEGLISWDSDNDILYVGDGGAALAINTLGTTVETAEITDGTVALADLAGNAVNATKIVDGSVTFADFDPTLVGAWTGSHGWTFGASEQLTVDATTTATTLTSGVMDLNISAGDAAVDGINLGLTANDGLTAATDVTGMELLLTANDADADLFGLTITAAATANAAAGSYEAAIRIDNAENTAGSMPDAIVIAATTDTAITDALDVSDAEIVNAVNIGTNPIVTALTTDGASVAGTLGNAKTASWTLTTDSTGDAEVVLPAQSIGSDELAIATLAGNPALTAGQVTFDAADSQGGVLFEGATANAFEGLLTVGEPTADRTWTLPNATGSIPLLETANEFTARNSFTSVPGGTGAASATVYINPVTSTADYKVFAVAVNNVDFFNVDNEGDIAVIGPITSAPTTALTTAINLSDTDIVTALALGANDVTVGGVTLQSTELALLDGKTVLGDGDITAVTAGAGLTGGADSGAASVAVGAGTGITVNADDVAINTAVVPRLTAQNTFTSVPAGTGAANAPIYINPESATADYKLFAVAAANVELMSVDAEGDVTIAGTTTSQGGASYSLGTGESVSLSHSGITTAVAAALNVSATIADTNNASGMLVTVTDNTSTGVGVGLGVVGGNGAATLDAGVLVRHTDTGQAMTRGVWVFGDTGATITTAVDLSDDDIGAAINIGENPIITGDVAGTLGDNTTNSWTVLTDGTGGDTNAEVVLPTGSIGSGEILDATITGDDLAANIGITTSGTVNGRTSLITTDGATALTAAQSGSLVLLSGEHAITLPTPVGNTGVHYKVLVTGDPAGAQSITCGTAGVLTIIGTTIGNDGTVVADYGAAADSVTFTTNMVRGASIEIVSTGAEWVIVINAANGATAGTVLDIAT